MPQVVSLSWLIDFKNVSAILEVMDDLRALTIADELESLADRIRKLVQPRVVLKPEDPAYIERKLAAGKCINRGCDKAIHSRGLCSSHLKQISGMFKPQEYTERELIAAGYILEQQTAGRKRSAVVEIDLADDTDRAQHELTKALTYENEEKRRRGLDS